MGEMFFGGKYFVTNTLLLMVCMHLSVCRVLELDDRFREAKKSGQWLIMFYAPWCGHCKQLEPIWMEVGEAMQDISSVHVARLDCTKHSALSETFGIRGFPTINYISGENIYEYKGPRTKSDIINFAQKAQGPSVTHLPDQTAVDLMKKDHEVSFLYIGDKESNLNKVYQEVARMHFISLNFYATKTFIDFDSTRFPNILVVKDKTYYEMPLPHDTLTKASLSRWVLAEQLPSYVELTGVTYHGMKSTGKSFAIFMLPEENVELLSGIGEELALARREDFHSKFLFCWVKGNKIVNSLTYGTVSVPNIVVYNPSTYEYFLPEPQSENILHKAAIETFLNKVIHGEITAKGGSGFLQQLKRFFADIFNMIFNLFKDSPIMGSLIIGVPTFVITFLCYCLCTLDDSEAANYSTDSEEEQEDEQYLEDQEVDSKEGPSELRKRNISSTGDAVDEDLPPEKLENYKDK